ncbi:MAG: ribonuclease III [Clostridia bacterium]|nr:ribonuclease III [Clostridia bacterium]
MSIEQEINYEFHNKELLQVALAHTSYANEHKGQASNERTEYLGDAVLELISSEYIFKNYPNLSEGEMTKARAYAVCENSLVKVASKYHFEKFLLLGKCETSGPRPSMLADSVEAVIGAIFLDSGFEAAKAFILPNIIPFIEEFVKGGNKDYKTQLQEKLQVHGDVKIEYKLIAERGEDHEKVFEVEVYCDSKLLGKGQGKSKKEAEMEAAKAALQ